ncbi:MAG: O-antigen ligase family protein [Clostridiales bacterium]|nr:O-antigen ligase family protein [Clostridiales bacterium]
MKEALLKIKQSKAVEILKRVLSDKYFVVATACVTVLFYYLNLEIITIYYIALTGILTVLLLDDLTPLLSNFLFMCIMISVKHSPSTFRVGAGNGSDYLANPAILAQIVVLICLYVIATFVRLAFTIKQNKFKITPVFWTLVAFSAVLLLNGVFSTNYRFLDFVYGVFLAFCFLGIFCIVKDNLSCTKEAYFKIAFTFFVFSVALLLELAVKYISAGVIQDGKVNRNLLAFGWGMYNNFALLLLICVPSVMYLAGTQKYGYLYFVYSIFLSIGVILSMSRQAWVALVVIYLISLVALLLNGKYRLINSIITGVVGVVFLIVFLTLKDKILILLSGTPNSSGVKSAVLLLVGALYIIAISVLIIKCKNKYIKYGVTGGSLLIILIVAGIFHEKTFELLSKLIESSNGRNVLWKDAIDNFLSAPVFGIGFFVNLKNDPGFAGMEIIPNMYHNTFFQLLGSCGILGVSAYIAHRVFTVISFSRNMSIERSFIGLSILCILITTLFDNHLFYIFPTILYSFLLAILIKGQTPAEESEPAVKDEPTVQTEPAAQSEA